MKNTQLMFSLQALCSSALLTSLMLSTAIVTMPAKADEAAGAGAIYQIKPDLQNGERIYPLCGACHGNDAAGSKKGDLAGQFPAIAGQHQQVLIKQLKDIQSKKRLNPTMFPFVDAQTLGGDQGLVDVAAYIASLPLKGQPLAGPGDALDKGRELYASSCVGCHGAQGQGQAEVFYPRLQGQHFPYLQREIGWIKDKTRKNANPAMVAILQSYSEADVQAVADYISRMVPSE